MDYGHHYERYTYSNARQKTFQTLTESLDWKNGKDEKSESISAYLLALREVYGPHVEPVGYSRIRWMSGSSTVFPATVERLNNKDSCNK